MLSESWQFFKFFPVELVWMVRPIVVAMYESRVHKLELGVFSRVIVTGRYRLFSVELWSVAPRSALLGPGPGAKSRLGIGVSVRQYTEETRARRAVAEWSSRRYGRSS